MTRAKYDAEVAKVRAQIVKLRAEGEEITDKEDFGDEDQKRVDEIAAKIDALNAKIDSLAKLLDDEEEAEDETERAIKNAPAVIRSRGRQTANTIHEHAAKEGFSVNRAIEAVLENRSLRGIEKEVDDELRRTNGGRRGNFFVPFGDANRLNSRNLQTRNLDSTQGSFPTLWDAQGFVDFLYPNLVGPKLGWEYHYGLMAGTKFPRQTAIPTFSPVAEGSSASESDATIDDVTFLPHTVTANTIYTRRFGYGSIIAADRYIHNAMARALAVKLEYYAVNGSGSGNQVTGILNISGVQTHSTTSNALAYSDIMAMQRQLADANARFGDRCGWLTSPMGYALLQQTAKQAVGQSSTYPLMVMDDSGKINTEQVAYTTNVPENLGASTDYTALIYANWQFVNMAFFGDGVGVIVDPYTGSTSGNTTITYLMDFDIQATQPTAVVVCNNILT